MDENKPARLAMTEYTVNATFKIRGKYLVTFENEIRNAVHVLDFSIIPDTSKLYETDPNFKKLVKAEKQAKKNKQQYINKHNKQ